MNYQFAQDYLLLRYKAGPDRDKVTTTASSERTPTPYEWFEKSSRADQNQHVLVLWLEEEALEVRPLQKLSLLIQFIRGQRYNEKNGERVKIIGPHSSDILKDMVREARGHDINKWPDLKKVQFYAYGASAPDRQILNKTSDTVRTYFDGLFDLRRTIATDDTLAYGIATELKRRHIDPGHKSTDHIALISEWDTVYGQTLPQAVEGQFPQFHRTRPGWHSSLSGSEGNPPIYKFTYLRGLDGLLPSTEGKADRPQDKATTSGEKQASASDFFKNETDTQALERPIGQSQFDYLRRISEHLHKIDEDLRKQGPDNKIKAIGILGSDVFDKLLILRALRLEFPEALFFTTDFDEAFTIKSELPFTRNLIISSSFGPNLSEQYQGDIPFFRDTYQTSAFFATQMAIGDKGNRLGVLPDLLAERLRFPRIFEIGRTGRVLSFLGNGAPSVRLPPGEDERKACSKTLGSCNPAQLIAYYDPSIEWRSESTHDFQPPVEDLFPTYEGRSRKTLAWGLAGGALFGLGLLCFQNLRRSVGVEICLVAFGLAVGALTCAFWQPVARMLTGDGNGEPLVILEGVSVWPTVMLRIFGIILSTYFIWRALLDLHENLADITKNMKLDPEPEALWAQIKSGFTDRRSWRQKLTGLFDFSLGSDQMSRTLPFKVEAAWEAYIRQERLWPRFCRASIYTFLFMVLIAYCVLVPMFGMPTIPARGALAFNIYWWITFLDFLFMLFLTFLVFDATCFCLLFVNKLGRVQTTWPPTTMEVYKSRLRLQTNLIHDWIDLDFAARRTRCIGSLIYFPFALIALLIVSRSTVFANFAPSLTILIAQGISLSIVFGCAFMLWWAAKAARDTAKQNLTDGLIRAKDSEGNVFFAEQLESLLNQVNQLREGAFGPLSQQPLVKALLFPLSSVGWVALIQNGMLPGL